MFKRFLWKNIYITSSITYIYYIIIYNNHWFLTFFYQIWTLAYCNFIVSKKKKRNIIKLLKRNFSTKSKEKMDKKRSKKKKKKWEEKKKICNSK